MQWNRKRSIFKLTSRAGSSKQTIARTAFSQPAIEIEWIAIESSEYAVKVRRHKPWSRDPFVVDPRNVVHALSISLVNFIGDGTVFA